MIVTAQSWKKLFLFCLGLAAGVSFCMKWMEGDFLAAEGPFTIMGLELFYPQDKVEYLLATLSPASKMALQYHLWFDFVFMAGVYPGIASLCMMAREKRSGRLLKKLLYGLAALQLVAWAADIVENKYLLRWISRPAISNGAFTTYHAIVIIKWGLAILALIVALPAALRRRRTR